MTRIFPGTELAPFDSIVMTLAILGERVARTVEATRLEGDVPDEHRGSFFPHDLIIRDARRAAPGIEGVTLSASDIPSNVLAWATEIGLTDQELGAILLAASPSLDPRFEHFFIVLNNESGTTGPTITTALRLLGLDPSDPDNRALFDPNSRLCSLGLVDVKRENHPFPARTLHVSERVVRHLLGDDRFGADVGDYLRRIDAPDVGLDLLPTEPILPEPTWFQESPGPTPVVKAHPGSGALSRAVALLTSGGGDVLLLDGARLPTETDERRVLLRAAFTEAALAARPLIVDDRAVAADSVKSDVAVCHGFQVPTIVLTSGKVALADNRTVEVELAPALERVRSQWWTALGASGSPGLKNLLQRLEPEEIRARLTEGELVRTGRITGGYARQTQPMFLLDDVLVPAHVRAELDHLLERVRLRPTVIDDWGMRPGGLRGRGITALFAGESGTGKTMAAEALAGELGTPLFHVNLASVVDKYIGETEKNLERVFSEAENLDGVLLFDEADSVFGKRSDVSDARDRYANLEVAYLLQRIEAFDGLAILTTNLRSNLDPAFARRLDCILDFPAPDAELREAIWRACLGEADARLSDDEYRRLATLEMAGGAIRSSSVSAAFMAAGASQPVEFLHAVRGARREWVKLGLLAFPLQPVLDSAAPSDWGGG
jgi:hypothetical protein